jgi:Mg2+-importing ATPase
MKAHRGLTAAEAGRRLQQYGPNDPGGHGGRGVWRVLAAQLTNRLVLLLIAAALLSYFLGERLNSAVILAIVVLNAALGFVQEYRAERALAALRGLVTHTARVRRDGVVAEVPATAVVPGDVVLLGIGDRVPADLRLALADDLSLDESTLTGESLPVGKGEGPAFMGTVVASGYGEGIVTATGRATALGRTAAVLERKPHETAFQKNIRAFSDLLFRITVLMTAFVFLANAVFGKGIASSFLFALALAVGITPEALPVIVTIALSTGALRMARAKVIVKRLIAVENLGNVDVICCDKTGTLTVGEPTLQGYVDAAGRPDPHVLLLGLLCGDEDATARGGAPGKSLDRALWRCEAVSGLEPALAAYRMLDRNELDFTRRRMSVVVRGPEGTRLVVKGAPEAVLAASRLLPGDAAAIAERAAGFEADGYRVIAVAEKPIATDRTTAADETGLTLRGFLLFLDPPKADVREALAAFARLGVALKVMSGDGPVITRRICRDVGLSVAEDRVVTGAELGGLSDDAVRELVRRYDVFARVSPEQKSRLVEALSATGHVVGFLGDGVNDAAALRAADVGIAVDSGADVAKEAADIVLLEKSLGVLADGIVAGRRTFGNIVKYILNTISANFGNMSTVALSSLFLRFIPLLPSQILLNNLLSDGPLLTISTDNVDAELLRRPRKWHLELISHFMVSFGLLSAVFDLILIVALIGVFRAGTDLFRTAWFVESALSEIVVTFAIRTRSAFFRSVPGRWLVGASFLAGVATVGLPFTRAGQTYFAFVPLRGPVLALVAGVVVAYFASAELAKGAFFRRFEQ